MSQLEAAGKAGLLLPEESPRKKQATWESTLKVLASYNSPQAQALADKLFKKYNIDVRTINSDKKGNNVMEEETKTEETPSTSETPTEEANQ